MSCSGTSSERVIGNRALRLAALAILLTLVAACAHGPGKAEQYSVIRLTDLFKRAEKTVSHRSLDVDQVLNSGTELLGGVERPVIRQNPAGTLRYRLRIPRGAVLRFGCCMAPHTWQRSPDGMRFHVRARRIAPGGRREQEALGLFSVPFDPKNTPAHRRVFEYEVDLADLGGSEWELTFAMDHGAGGDVSWDNGLWIDPRITVPDGTVELPPRDPERPDILLVTVDSLRADVLATFGAADRAGPSTAGAPVINGLAAAGLRALAAYTPSTFTLPSYTTLLTGTLPANHGRHDERRDRPLEFPTAAERFAGAGYHTAAFLGTPGLAGRSGLSRGFEVFDAPRIGRRTAGETVLGLLEWIRRNEERPWFCWLQVNDLVPPLAHLRDRDRHYYPRGGFNRWDESIIRLLPHFERRPDLKKHWYRWLHDVTTVEYVEASYLGQVDEADRQLGRVLGELRRRGQLENTVVVVAANRGLALGDQGIFFTAESLVPAVTRVPLIFWRPGQIPAGSALPPQAACSTADVLPTLLSLLPPEAAASLPPGGIDLLAALRDLTPLQRRELFLEGRVGRSGAPNRFAVLAGRYKLAISPGREGILARFDDEHRAWSLDAHHQNSELFDRLTDPGEEDNLSGSRPLADVQFQLRQKLMASAAGAEAYTSR